MDIFAVEAYTASWIEINIRSIIFIALNVEAYTASWIEICKGELNIKYTSSKPIRLRGLK